MHDKPTCSCPTHRLTVDSKEEQQEKQKNKIKINKFCEMQPTHLDQSRIKIYF